MNVLHAIAHIMYVRLLTNENVFSLTNHNVELQNPEIKTIVIT